MNIPREVKSLGSARIIIVLKVKDNQRKNEWPKTRTLGKRVDVISRTEKFSKGHVARKYCNAQHRTNLGKMGHLDTRDPLIETKEQKNNRGEKGVMPAYHKEQG